MRKYFIYILGVIVSLGIRELIFVCNDQHLKKKLVKRSKINPKKKKEILNLYNVRES